MSGSVKLAVRVDGKVSGLQLVLRFRRDLALWTLGQQPEYAKVKSESSTTVGPVGSSGLRAGVC